MGVFPEGRNLRWGSPEEDGRQSLERRSVNDFTALRSWNFLWNP